MTAVSVCVVLGLVMLLLLRGRGLSLFSALVAVTFGLVLGTTPAGPTIDRALDATGALIWENGRGL